MKDTSVHIVIKYILINNRYEGSVCCLHLQIEFRSCARGVSGVPSFKTTDEQPK